MPYDTNTAGKYSDSDSFSQIPSREGTLSFATVDANPDDADILLRGVGTARSTWLPNLLRKSLPWLHKAATRVTAQFYPQGIIHSWYIPDDQLEEVREDPEIETAPGREFLDEEPKAVMELIEEHCADPDEGLTQDEIVELAQEEVGLSRIRAQSVLQNLRQGGHIRKRTRPLGIVYDPAK